MPETPDSHYRQMFRTLVWRLLLVTLLPLIVIGGANFYLFYSLNRSIVIEQHANALRSDRESIEAFLRNVTTELKAIANRFSLEELKAGNLERVFQVIQQSGVFTDIGIIDRNGDHVTYIGPYDLSGRNYRHTEWFQRVMQEGVYISDVFLGFRGVPHFIVAVKRNEGDTFWILRATFNTDYFSNLVDAIRIGETGETFIVNSQGLFQTKTRFAGELLTPSGFPDLTPHPGIRVREMTVDGRGYLYTTTWLNNPQWLVIFRQASSDVYSPLRRAVLMGFSISALGALAAIGLAIIVAGAQVRHIKKTDREKEALTQRLLVTGKTAAVGEMSAGVAHEINNPLATIDTLQTWISELARSSPISEEDRQEILDSAKKIGQQVERCKTITQGLLKFSRKVETTAEELDLNRLLEELAAFCRTRARVENVTVQTALRLIPTIVGPPGHLQQIFVNLLNNALDAVAGKPNGMVLIRSRYSDGKVKVEVSDNGSGIPAENVSRIFLPFFTTKPVGQGTGLGLAIVYGLVQDLGGSINVESTVGVGSTFSVQLPLHPPPEGQGERAKGKGSRD
ncbi:MAG: sensor histidine kinase [Acidobacteriota bacterium]